MKNQCPPEFCDVRRRGLAFLALVPLAAAAPLLASPPIGAWDDIVIIDGWVMLRSDLDGAGTVDGV